MNLEARSFWIAEPGRGEIRTELLPPPANGDVVVRALFSGISRGTESLVFAGRVPASEWTRMRAPFQAGNFPAPVKYGYASVGRVEQGPTELRDRAVFVLYPHQTRYVVPSSALHVLPEAGTRRCSRATASRSSVPERSDVWPLGSCRRLAVAACSWLT